MILVRVSMKLSFDDKESFKEAAESLRFNNPPSDSSSLAHQRLEMMGCGLLPQDSEMNDDHHDINLTNPPSDIITLQRVGSSSSMPPQERSEDT